MHARYRFAVRFRLEPAPEDARVDPDTFETTLYKRAPPPGEEGWRFFRDHLWRGDVNDPEHVRGLVEETIDVPVERVEFRAFETDREYLEALREGIADDLVAFRADSIEETLSKHLGSAIEVDDAEGF